MTRCRDCGTDHSRRTLVVFLVFLVASAVVFWFLPMLGALMMIGAVGGLGVVVLPAALERVSTWLSVGR